MWQPRTLSLIFVACTMSAGAALAKLPPPSEEAKAKAEEAKAKAAHGDKLGAYQLCNSMDKVAQRYLKDNKGRKPVETPKCQDPGSFQYVAATPAAAPAATPATPAAPAPTAAKAK